MPSKLIGPDFEDFTITSETLRWLHSCRWEASHAVSFHALRAAFTHSFGKVPNLVKSKTHPSPGVTARWLLVDEEEKPHAWAELQSFPLQRDQRAVLIWGMHGDKTPNASSLTKLITYCFIVGKYDHLTVGGSRACEEDVVINFAKDAGECRQALTLSLKPWHPHSVAPSMVKTYRVGREEWMASPASEDPSKTLEMIRARILRFEKSQGFLSKKRKKRGLLARLFNPKINDPLF